MRPERSLQLAAHHVARPPSLAVIEGFPASIVAVDLAWGTVATALAAAVTYAVCRRVPALR